MLSVFLLFLCFSSSLGPHGDCGSDSFHWVVLRWNWNGLVVSGWARQLRLWFSPLGCAYLKLEPSGVCHFVLDLGKTCFRLSLESHQLPGLFFQVPLINVCGILFFSACPPGWHDNIGTFFWKFVLAEGSPWTGHTSRWRFLCKGWDPLREGCSKLTF